MKPADALRHAVKWGLGGAASVILLCSQSASAAPITEQAVPGAVKGSLADWIATGPDGAVSVTLLQGTSVSSIVTYTGPKTAGRGVPCLFERQNCRTGALINGPGGLWFTTTIPISAAPVYASPGVGSLSGGLATIMQQFQVTDIPFGIAADRTGVLWVALAQGVIVRYDPVAQTVDRFSLAEYTNGPALITLGADGAMWFTQKPGNKIGRIATEAPELVGSVTQYNVPTARAGVYGIAPGPDGATWFAESRVGQIGRITSDGSVQEFRTNVKGSTPRNLVAGPDNAMWFTDPGTDSIGRITMDGKVTEYPLPTSKAIVDKVPNAITLGGDGFLWFTENNANENWLATVGRLDPMSPPSATARTTTVAPKKQTAAQKKVAAKKKAAAKRRAAAKKKAASKRKAAAKN